MDYSPAILSPLASVLISSLAGSTTLLARAASAEVTAIDFSVREVGWYDEAWRWQTSVIDAYACRSVETVVNVSAGKDCRSPLAVSLECSRLPALPKGTV